MAACSVLRFVARALGRAPTNLKITLRHSPQLYGGANKEPLHGCDHPTDAAGRGAHEARARKYNLVWSTLTTRRRGHLLDDFCDRGTQACVSSSTGGAWAGEGGLGASGSVAKHMYVQTCG